MNSDRPIYFDYMATTPIDPRVIEKMLCYMGPEGEFGNPASTTHLFGRKAAVAVERARQDVAALVGASEEDIVFTSGATEANNLAIIGASTFYQRRGRHLVTLMTEHKSVLDSFKHLERCGFEVTYLKPEPSGLLSLETLLSALREDTLLVSLMHVNNEIGVIQPIESIASALSQRGVLFHVDAAQSAGKLPIRLSDSPIDLMSFSAHKIYGPKGVGALYVRHKPRVRLVAQTYGGGHEGGLRSGTLATHQIVGMGKAFELARTMQAAEYARLQALHQRLWEGIKHLPGLVVNGDMKMRIANNLNLRFEGVHHDDLLIALKDIAFSTASACVVQKAEPSYVLRAIGLSVVEAQSSIRLSFGRFTSEEEIDTLIAILSREIPMLYELKKDKK